MMLDEKLDFKDHMNYLENVARSNLCKIKDLYNKHFGLPTHLALQLYNCYMRTILESTYPCWSTVPEESLNKFESIQGEVMRAIIIISGKVSHNALDVEAGILPIKIRLKQILAQFGVKILRKPNEDPIKQIIVQNLRRENIGKSVTLADKIRMALTSYTKNKIDFDLIEPEFPIYNKQVSTITPDLFLWKGYGNSTSRTEKQKSEMKNIVDDHLRGIPDTDIICFTDGSVINPDNHGMGRCGAGITIYEKGLEHEPITIEEKVSTYSTAYHGEICAIKFALRKCQTLHLTNVDKIHIFSDCQSAIMSIINNKNADSHQDEINDINKMAKSLENKNIETIISWVGGHSEIEGNILADTAAKNGALKPDDIQTKVSQKMAKNIILNGAMEHWQKKWTISTTGQHLKNIQTRVSLGNSSKCLKSRKSQISLHQIKLGRSDLNGQDPINKKQLNEKLCIFCNCVEDTEHYILFCHRYSCQRRNMFLQIESTLAENNISSRDVRKNLLFLAENKDLPLKVRQEILGAIETFLISTSRL